MSFSPKKYIMAGLLMAVSGCIIVPGRNQEIRQPDLSGRLVTSSGPLENKALFYSWIDERTPCSRIAGATTTDAQGYFRFDARETYSKPFVVTLAPSTPVYFLHICQTDGMGLSPIYSRAFA